MSQSSIETLQITNYVRGRLCNYADESAMIALVREALLLYGTINDVALVKYLVPLYQRAAEVCSETSRFECYRYIAQKVERGTVSINALTPFLLHESSLRIVSTAAIDYAMVNWSSSDEPLAAARQLGLDKVPVIVLADLAEVQRRQLVLADNRIAVNDG